MIGRRAAGVAVDDALDHVEGYVVANDVSGRDLQFADGQWVRGKSLDTFLPVGDLVPAAEVPDPQALPIRAILNGDVMQDSNTSNMIFGVAEMVSFVSQAITLEPGDLIITGTPAGVGAFRDPPVWLRPATRSRSRSTASARSRTLSSRPDRPAPNRRRSEMSFVLVVHMKVKEGEEARALELDARAGGRVTAGARLRGLRPVPQRRGSARRSCSSSSTATKPRSRSTARPSISSGSPPASSSG